MKAVKEKTAIIMSVFMGDNLEFVKESLESLFAQTHKEFDIFLQCDGMLQRQVFEYINQEYHKGNIKILGTRSENKGLAYSLNELTYEGLRQGYEYFVRMDADDICARDRVEKQLEFMRNNPNVDVVGSNILEFYEDGSERLVTYATLHEKIKADFSKKTAIPHVTAFFRKSFFDKAGLYNVNSNRNEDQWLWLSGFMSGCIFASVPSALVKVRISSGLLNRRGDFKHNLDTFFLRNKIVHKLRFSFFYYFYNLFVFLIKCLPGRLLQIIYKFR